MNILHIDSSARRHDSVGRGLTRQLVEGLVKSSPDAATIRRELDDLPMLTAALLAAVGTPAERRTVAQQRRAELPDRLIEELENADVIVIGVPIYNFGVPAALKAWIDLVARARRTFRYSEDGPIGLLGGRPVYLVVTSGGTALGSDIDFATPYLRHVLGFLGLTDVRVIDATRLMVEGDSKVAAAAAAIQRAIRADAATPAVKAA